MLVDKTGKFEVLASDYAKSLVRSFEEDVVVVGYRWDKGDEVDNLLWFIEPEGQALLTIYNETEAEEW